MTSRLEWRRRLKRRPRHVLGFLAARNNRVLGKSAVFLVACSVCAGDGSLGLKVGILEVEGNTVRLGWLPLWLPNQKPNNVMTGEWLSVSCCYSLVLCYQCYLPRHISETRCSCAAMASLLGSFVLSSACAVGTSASL